MTDLKYRIERTKNRSSRASLVGNTIVIRLARGLPAFEESRHIENLLKRMSKIQARLASMPLLDPFRTLLDGADALTLTLPSGSTIEFSVVASRKFRAEKTTDGWRIEKPDDVGEKDLQRFLWKLTALHQHDAMERFVHATNAATLQLPVRNVTLRMTRSRWGSCSRTGNISLSTALLFVPVELQEYVIVHELAHIQHADHSHRFWRTVESVMPDYKERLKELKRFRLPQT